MKPSSVLNEKQAPQLTPAHKTRSMVRFLTSFSSPSPHHTLLQNCPSGLSLPLGHQDCQTPIPPSVFPIQNLHLRSVSIPLPGIQGLSFHRSLTLPSCMKSLRLSPTGIPSPLSVYSRMCLLLCDQYSVSSISI